jgi:tetratricopeptide (TPR) repeat protein
LRAVLTVCITLVWLTSDAIAQPSRSALAAAHTGNAVRMMQDRRYTEAASEFEQSLVADPDNDNVRIQYATCLFAQERNDESRRQFEILRQHKGDWPGLEYYLGLLDYRVNDFASAIRRLQPLRSNPAFPKSALYTGLAYLAQGQTALALQNLELAARNDARDPQVHYRLGRLYSLSGRTEDANHEYKLYRDLDENRRLAESFGAACMDALRAQPIDKARPVCERIAVSGDSERLTLLGQLYTQAGAFADAVPPLERATALTPESFDAWNYLGASLFSLHRYQEAVAPLRKAVALNPDFFDTLNLLAATLHTLGDDPAALPVLERAHNLKPDDAALTNALDRMRAVVNGKR